FVIRNVGKIDLVVDRNVLLDTRTRFAEMLHQWREVIFENQHAGFGMIQDRSQFGGGETHVERHHDALRQGNSVITFQERIVTKAEISAAIAGAQTGCRKTGRQALATLTEFGISVTAISGNNAALPAIKIDAAIETAYRRKWNIHDSFEADGHCNAAQPYPT